MEVNESSLLRRRGEFLEMGKLLEICPLPLTCVSFFSALKVKTSVSLKASTMQCVEVFSVFQNGFRSRKCSVNVDI
jgi:hypothetical protein